MMRPPALLLAVLLLMPAVATAQEEELLEPDKAFALTTRVLDGNTLEANWNIAPGYYLYRDKIKFEALDGGVALGSPVFPGGKQKDDPLFGRVETYTKSVRVRLPIDRAGAGAARLKITFQGCNEPIGVCYPPIVKEVVFNLPAPKAAAAIAAAPARSLKDVLTSAGTEQEVMDPELAFGVGVMPEGGDALRVRVTVADCCYLYRDKTRFELARADGAPPAGVRLGAYTLPPGKEKTDEFIGKTEVYTGSFEMRLALEGAAGKTADLALRMTYQGCAETPVAICYPPSTKTFPLRLRAGALTVDTPAAPPFAPEAGDTLRARVDAGTFLLAMLAAFGTGLLLTFTPCVLPMIPILSSVIVGASNGKITKLRGGLLSASYVLGTAVTYTAAGAIAGATGEQLQAYFQNPWIIGIFSALFVALAFSMFGFYELHIPAFIQSFLHHHSSRLHHHSKRFRGGVFFGVFLVGLFAALIVGACVSPLIISALGAAIASRDPYLGGAIMFSMALGMGAILIAIGVGAGFLLPRAGPWMERTKHVFGVLLIAVAIYLLGFIPQVPVLLAWAALFIVSAIYLGATESLPHGASGWRTLSKGFGTLLLAWGVIALLGGLAGNRDILSPLPIGVSGGGLSIGAPATPAAAERLFTRVKTLRELETRLAEAKAAGKPAILDYYADWCTDCLRMEKATFADARVRADLEGRFVRLQVDVTNPADPEVKAIKGRFGVYGPPALLFFGPSGVEQRALRTYGFRAAEEFLALLRKV